MQPPHNDTEILAAIVCTFAAFLVMAIAVLIFIYFSRKKILHKEIEKKQLEVDYQKKLLQSILITQEEERNRIAQDLHDAISSKMNVISLNAHLLSESDLSKEEYDKIVSGILSVSSTVLESSRKIAHDLLPPILDKFGLHAALEELCRTHNNSQLTVSYRNEARQLFFIKTDKSNQLHIFRIFQELINNSLRHGKATAISIVATSASGSREIIYADNGIGFNTDDTNSKPGIGMKNIESRAAFIGADFSIMSAPGQGVNAKLTF